MNSDQLHKFKIVAKNESLTKAAKELYLTQSALSHTITNLEKELECTLFNRYKQKIYLTDEGKRLLKYAEEIELILDKLVKDFEKKDTITIGSINAYASFVLSMVPENRLSDVVFKRYESSILLDLLLNNRIDAAICDDFFLNYDNHIISIKLDSLNDQLQKKLIYVERLGLMVPPNHPLYDAQSVTYDELMHYPLCLQADKPALTEWIENIEKTIDKQFDIAFSLDRYLYKSLRNKIPYPEITEISSVYEQSKEDSEINKKYHYVRIEDIYSSRNIYLYYLESKSQKIELISQSIKDFYSKPRIIYHQSNDVSETVSEIKNRTNSEGGGEKN